MASKFKITQSGVSIKRGIKFHFGGDFNYSVIIDCQLDGTWRNGFFTWSGAGPGLTGQTEVFNGESSFVLRGTYENVNDATDTGSFVFSPTSGTIPTNGFVDVQVTPYGSSTVWEKTEITYNITGDMPYSGDIGIDDNNNESYETILTVPDDSFEYIHKATPKTFFINMIYTYNAEETRDVEFNIGGIRGSDLELTSYEGFNRASAGSGGNNLLFNCNYLPNQNASATGILRDCFIGDKEYGNVTFIVTATYQS